MGTIATFMLDDSTKSVIQEFCKEKSHQFLEIDNINTIIDSLQDKKPDILILYIKNINAEIVGQIKNIRNEPLLKQMTIFTYLESLDVKTEVAFRRLKLSSFFLRTEDEKQGHKHLIKGISLHLKYLESLKNKGTVKQEKALDLKNEGIVKQEKALEPPYDIGESYMKKGMYDEAIKSFYDAAKSPKMYFTSYRMIGLCHQHMGRKAKAISILLEGFKTAGNKKERTALGHELGNILKEVGRKKDALKIYVMVYKLDPAFAGLKDKIDSLKKGI